MHCPICGTSNVDQARFCVQCAAGLRPDQPAAPAAAEGAPAPVANPYRPPVQQPDAAIVSGRERIPNHLVLAIVTTACCCMPLGVVSLIHAAQVDQKQAKGDVQGALDCSQKAKFWALIGLPLGAVGNTLMIALQIWAESHK